MLWLRWRRRRRLLAGGGPANLGAAHHQNGVAGGAHPEFASSGFYDCSSGSGLPLLQKRTISKQVHLCESIGKGRYGEVHRGIWNDRVVAVKIFSSREAQSWQREIDVYNTTMLRHDNILGFIGSDKNDTGTTLQHWLVTEYHPNGSLRDYLNSTALNVGHCILIALSLADGLSYLHKEVSESKPAIAHRDIKSSNLLVKADGSCCIADLGLAIRCLPDLSASATVQSNYRQGTVRYMAPECLNGSIERGHFGAYKQTDVYAASLVMWETMWRTVCSGIPETEHVLPYANQLQSPEPTVGEMYEEVCVKETRPLLRSEWSRDQAMSRLAELLPEMWCVRPSVRLPAQRIKQTVQRIQSECNAPLSLPHSV